MPIEGSYRFRFEISLHLFFRLEEKIAPLGYCTQNSRKFFLGRLAPALKTILIYMSYQILVASLTLMALF